MLLFLPYLAGPPRRLISAPPTMSDYNEGPYLRPSSQGSWMEAMRAHRKCVPSSFTTHTVRNQFTNLTYEPNFRKREKPMEIKKLTPNLVVRNVEASLKFYLEILGLEKAISVPDESPYIFASVSNGSVEIFFNDQKTVAGEYPK